MSGSTNIITGVTTTTTGIAILPNTGGNIFLTVFGVVTMVFGVLITSSFIFTRLILRFSK